MNLPQADAIHTTDNFVVDQSASGINRTAKTNLTAILQMVPLADTSTFGLTRPGSGLTVTNGTMNLNYVMPFAAANSLGGIKVGGGLQIDNTGVLSVTGGGGGGTTYTATPPIAIVNGVISVTVGTTSGTVAAGNHTHSIYEQNANKGQANGYASLDGTGKVPSAQLPGAAAITGIVIDGTTVTSPHTILPTEMVVDVNKGSGSATTVTLPANPTLWVPYIIIDGKRDSSVNNITITAPGGVTIDGQGTAVLNVDGESLTLLAISSTVWRIV